MNYLSVENVSKRYGERLLFEHVTFGILKGQKVALVAQGMPQMPSEGSWGPSRAPSGILLLGFFSQDSSSEMPPQEILLEDSSQDFLRIPLLSFLLQDSIPTIPP